MCTSNITAFKHNLWRIDNALIRKTGTFRTPYGGVNLHERLYICSNHRNTYRIKSSLLMSAVLRRNRLYQALLGISQSTTVIWGCSRNSVSSQLQGAAMLENHVTATGSWKGGFKIKFLSFFSFMEYNANTMSSNDCYVYSNNHINFIPLLQTPKHRCT